MERKNRRKWIGGSVLAAIVALAVFLAGYFGLLPQKSYTGADFGIQQAVSAVDYNKNGKDDYSDFLSGARKDAQNHPQYSTAYYEGGYPPKDVGVCTDVIWRAFREAGYSFKEMLDRDIAAHPERYPGIESPDPNIDFRRVGNLRCFLDAYAVSLTTDKNDSAEWQPGDIVVFGKDRHIGIVSDRRNKNGQPYIIHNGGQPMREENYLPRAKVTAHYRFDASLLPDGVAVPDPS